MKILAVHNRYLWRGGEDASFEAEVAMLRMHGHLVEEYLEDNRRVESLGRLRTAARTVWSHETYRRVRDILRDGHHDLVYAQNTFPLVSPSLYYAARVAGVPVIQTLRNYRLMCLNGLLFRDGKICEECVGKAVPWPGIMHGCYRDSRAASAAVAAMLVTHRLLGTFRERVGAYVALTEFCRDKFIEGGLPAELISIKPNFVDPDPGASADPGQYALYVGRLSREKGLDTLLAAWARLGPGHPLKIVGDGPLAEEVARAAAGSPDVECLGPRTSAEVRELLQGAKFLVFPSRVFENFPRIIVEAFATGVPVIASRHGSMSLIVEDGATGLHFVPGDAADLGAKVAWAWAHAVEIDAMRHRAREEYLMHYTADASHRILDRIISSMATRSPSPVS